MKLENDGYINCFGEDFVELFVNEMLEIETYLKDYFENEIEISPNTIVDHDETNCWLCEKKIETKKC